MKFQVVLFIAGLVSVGQAAAVHAVRQASSSPPSPTQQTCPVATVYSYITKTVTDFPNTVTVAVPDYSAISSSLASASTVDSLVVVHNSENRPVLAPPDTRIPTFVESIKAPAVELTEASHLGTSVFYLPGTRPASVIDISATTISIKLSYGSPAPPEPTSASQSAAKFMSSNSNSFTMPAGGWNGTNMNSTNVAPATGMSMGTGTTTSIGINSTITKTTYVSTTTYVTNVTVTATDSAGLSSEYGDSGYGSYVKRQTCVLISAPIGGHMASWCNNWDGSTTYSFTSWKTTITPGVVPGISSSSSLGSTSTSTSTQTSTTTVLVSDPTTTANRTVLPVAPTNSTQLSVTSGPVASSTPSSCGEAGPFNINFDDLPKQSVSDNLTAGLPPIFQPFEHFFWANGWSYLPPPSSLYLPHDGDQLAIYVPDPQGDALTDADNSALPPGGFGAGQRSSNEAYWFNARSAWIGCDNNVTNAPSTCDFVAEGYRFDNVTGLNQLHTTQHFSHTLCPSPPCQLQQIEFSPAFSQLTTISFYAKIGGSVHTFYVDDLQLSWFDNSCDAGILRASGRK